MNSFRLNTVKNTNIIYAYSFRLCQPYFPVESQQMYLSRTGLSLYNIERIMRKSPISHVCFLFVPRSRKAERGIWKCRASVRYSVIPLVRYSVIPLVRYFVSLLIRSLVRPSEICCKRSKIFIC